MTKNTELELRPLDDQELETVSGGSEDERGALGCAATLRFSSKHSSPIWNPAITA